MSTDNEFANPAADHPGGAPAAARQPGWKHRWLRRALIAAGVAGLWTAVVGAGLPHWGRPHAEAAASQALGTPVTIGRIRVQPWTGLIGVEGLRIGPASAPLLALQQAEVQLSVESVWRLAPVLRRVTLTRPDIWIERQTAQRFNFTPIIEKLSAAPAQPEDEDATPPRFAVFNILVQDGTVRYTDRVLAQTHRIDRLRVGVPFVSSLPSQVHVDVEPMLSARVDGSPLELKGRTLPFKDDLKSELDIRLAGLDVPHWLAAAQSFLPPEWRPQARSGRMDVALTLGFAMRPPPAVPMLSIKGRVQLDELALNWPDAPVLGRADLAWGSLKIEGIDAQPWARQVAVGKVGLDGLRWQSQLRPLAPQAEAVPPSTPAADAPGKPLPASSQAAAWDWRVGQIDIQAGRIDVQPVPMARVAVVNASAGQAASRRPGDAAQAGRWPAFDMARVQLKGLDGRAAAAPASWQLTLHDEHQGVLQAEGKVQVARQVIEARLDLSRLQLAPWLAPLSPVLPLPLQLTQGEVAMQASLDARLLSASAAEMAQARLLSGRVRLQGIEARASAQGAKDHIRLAELTLEGMQAQLDLAGEPTLRRAQAERLHIDQLDAALTRGARGEWLGMVPPAQAGAQPAARRITAEPAGAPMPDIQLKALYCQACQARLTDQSVTPAAQFDVSKMNLRLADLSAVLSRPIQVELDTLAQGRGQLRFKGEVRPEPLAVQGSVKVAALDLRTVQPYIDPLVNIRLTAAKAQADGQLTVQDKGPGAGLGARYKGRAGLSDVRVQDRVNEADFLRWQTLSLDGLDVNWAGQALDADLGRIALKDFYGRVIINPGGELNLAGIMRQQAGGQAQSLTTPQMPGGGAPSPAAAAAPPPAMATASAAVVAAPASAALPTSLPTSSPPSSSGKPPPKLRWQQIQLAKGRIDFTDNFIQPNYSARLTQIEGQVSAVSSTQPEPATLQIAGAVDDAAPLRITGQLHPLGPRLFTDIQGSAKGIELTRLTPYAARYAGYAIDKGTLSVTVHYKVDGGKLEASNQIFLDQLTFGDKADSPDALNLPVRLAVSLLQNSRGEIDVNLPISGSLDDPEFSVGGIIWRVIVNLITKAVTAPFALLTGGGTDELGLVPFEPGSARLSEAATQRLDTLAAKLLDRPALKLEATGRADPAFDVEGLRSMHVNRLMRAAKAKATGLPLAQARIADEERLTWLTAAYKAADIKKPRNLIGIAKTLSAAEMEALLKADAAVDEQALRTLANRRGDAVKAYLAEKLPPERVLLTASKIGTDGLPEDKEPSTRVQFTVK